MTAEDGENTKSRLLFVYNADSGLPNKAIDFLHKAFSPATYQCSLCAITYGTFTIKKEWKAFLEELPYPVEFWYKDEFRRAFSLDPEFPCVYLAANDSLEPLLSAGDMENISLEELMEVLRHRLPKE